MKHIIKFLFITIFVQSCSLDSASKNERECDCPVGMLVDQRLKVDSTSVYTEDDLFDWSVGGKISGKVKKIINVELEPKTKLIDHYQDNYGFRQYGRYLGIEGDTSQYLVNKYLGDE